MAGRINTGDIKLSELNLNQGQYVSREHSFTGIVIIKIIIL